MKETERHFEYLLQKYGFEHNYLLKFDPLVQVAATSLITAITDYLDTHERFDKPTPETVLYLLKQLIVSEKRPAAASDLDKLFNKVAIVRPVSMCVCNYKIYKTFPGYIQREAHAILMHYYTFKLNY